MQGSKKLRNFLEMNADAEHYLFGPADFSPAFPELSPDALKMLVSRSASDGLLEPMCRGVYAYARAPYPRGTALYHAAAKLRAGTFNYISLESALSDAGVISQVLPQWITLMSGGRSALVRCGTWGTIEFVHTRKKPEDLVGQLTYDRSCRLWRASVALAVSDMKACRRPLDLIDWDTVHELV